MKRRVKIIICLFFSAFYTLSVGCTNTDNKPKVDKQPVEKTAIYKNKNYSTEDRV